ncbi:MAG: hypothetical protein DRJ03_17175 [Chloroflexi bacterium]|nr:MAG: hypothetical protein DRJ03_17175 [Chloroflexota bacterium]
MPSFLSGNLKGKLIQEYRIKLKVISLPVGNLTSELIHVLRKGSRLLDSLKDLKGVKYRKVGK